ncbi:MAG: hypothetical protein Q9214_002489 [Letrouitia sp. 1 TL-2023]
MLDTNATAPGRKSILLLPRLNKGREATDSLRKKHSNLSLGDRPPGLHCDRLANGTSARASRINLDQHEKQQNTTAPPAYGDNANSTLALPVSRLSESSRSDGSLGDHGLYATTTTTHTVSTTTTFFRLPRRKKNKGPLFPLPVKPTSHEPSSVEQSDAYHSMTKDRPSDSSRQQSPARTLPLSAVNRHSNRNSHQPSPVQSPSRKVPGIAFSATNFPALRRDSTASIRSGRSSPALALPTRNNNRGRSSTKGSLRGYYDDEPLETPPVPQSGRTSSSTGRASLGGFFSLSRLRQHSEPQFPRHGSGHIATPGTPISTDSKAHSFSLLREPIVVPERKEGDTPAKYLVRLEEAVSRCIVATILSKSDDEFSKSVLRSYMRGFKFFGDPLDMSIRKLLMEAELPKETQQIDRVLQAFANRYHECNPGIYASPDEAYFVAFSILILHTDVFNKNNKHKMQKQDYTKNARGTGVADEILECFYDNISYTPFIHVEDDVDINGDRIVAHSSKKGMFTRPSVDSTRKSSREPVDPYTLILDNRLDSLRPSLKDVMNLDDPYNYLGTANSLNLNNLHKTFFRTGVLQIVSSRSRPEAFMSPETTTNPAEAHPGVVDIKVTKVGILWRKDLKKKKARSPWQEWGAILTGAQLYFFRNTTWIKNLVSQCNVHHKHGLAGTPCIFKPALEHFKPDVLMSTQDAVALQDASYKKHKYSLLFVRHGGLEETFLADNEADMNDWLAKLNFASAFRSAGVRMRSLVESGYDSSKPRETRRMDTDSTIDSVQKSLMEDAHPDYEIDTDLAHQIREARKQIMTHKLSEADEKLEAARKQLDVQLRNARHLQILAPIQNRTREQLILAAGGMAAKIKWVRLEMWRTRCHKDILAMDLDEEARTATRRSLRTNTKASAPDLIPSIHSPSRKLSAAEHTNNHQISPRIEGTTRPSTQPSPSRALSTDDVFQSQTQGQSGGFQPRSRGSWELPPLSFEPTRSSLKSGSSVGFHTPARAITPAQHSIKHEPSIASVRGSDKVSDLAAKLATPTPSMDDEEQGILREAGLVRPETPTPNSKRPETTLNINDVIERDLDMSKSPASGFNDGRSKVRRSLQRTLREAHGPNHHRSKRGRDSGSSVGITDEPPSAVETERLARGTGSFTVHGKKASVITFGSEWQDMSPEERLKHRKQIPGDASKVSMISAVEDEAASPGSDGGPEVRRRSVTSMSSAATSSLLPDSSRAEHDEQSTQVASTGEG